MSDQITPEIGMKVTVCGYSDRKVFDIIKMSKKSITLRERKAILVKKPVMVPGGFAAVVVENAIWRTEEDPNGQVKKATLRKDGKYKVTGSNSRCILDLDSYHYDYSF